MAEKTKNKPTRSNPILKMIHGVPIRNRNKIAISYNARDYEKIVNGAHDNGVSLSAYINLHLQPCNHCHADTLIIPRAKIPRKTYSDGKTSIFERNK